MGSDRKGRGRAYYGNGVFEYVPPLADGKCKQDAKEARDITFKDGALRGKKADAYITFEHVSPYIIAARPVEGGDRDWNVMKDKCRDGAIVSGAAIGEVPVTISVDGGQNWQSIGAAAGDFKLDFTDAVKGRHQYLVRFHLSKAAGLKALQLRTVTQVGRGVFPRLKDGGTTVTYQASGRAVIHGGPSEYLAEQYRRKDLEQEGSRIYQIKAPGRITGASGVARVSGKGPWSVEFSVDGGKTWQAGLKDLKVAGDGKLWDDGRSAYAWAEMDFPKNKSKDVLIRFGQGNIAHCQVFATCETKNTSPLRITYGWQEGDEVREDSHRVKSGGMADTWTVPTGQAVKTKWVRFAAED
jgi:hypothetical protein